MLKRVSGKGGGQGSNRCVGDGHSVYDMNIVNAAYARYAAYAVVVLVLGAT